MPVLEIALLRLKSGVSVSDERLLSGLRFVHRAMSQSAGDGLDFHYLQQTEDPSCIYILGSWPSVKHHYEVFIPSFENQQALEMVKDLLDVEALLHVDLDPKEVPLRSGFIAITRHHIKAGEREAFDATFAKCKGPLVEATEGQLVGGWREDSEEGKEEWVLLTSWEALEDHTQFGNSERFKEYATIRDHVDKFEVKHAKVLNIV